MGKFAEKLACGDMHDTRATCEWVVIHELIDFTCVCGNIHARHKSARTRVDRWWAGWGWWIVRFNGIC